MADQEVHSSRAEQRMAAVAKLKRAASLPRMKDGRRPPMHNESVSEGEKVATEEDKATSDEEKQKSDEEPLPPPHAAENEAEDTGGVEEKERTPEPDSDHPPPAAEKTVENEVDADTELEERPMSPSVTKKRRSRSRSRSRGSKDFKGKIRATQSPFGGDSSQDENPPVPPPIVLPMVPPLISPIPHFPFLQQSRFLRSPTPVSPEMSLFYPGTSPPTPLPTLEDLQKGLMRSNSAGSSAGRRMAMHKLTGGTESYDPVPSPTPPPFTSKLSRNNTVSGGERIAARQNMLSRLARVTRETDGDTASGAEDRFAPSPTPKRRRRRSRRNSNPNGAVSDSDFQSTDANTPAVPTTPLPNLQDQYAHLRAMSTTPNQLSSSRAQSSERVSDGTPPPPLPPAVHTPEEEHDRPEHHRRRSVLIEDPDEDDRNPPQQRHPSLPGTPQRTFHNIEALRTPASNTPSNASTDSGPSSAVGVPVFFSHRAPSRTEPYPSSPFTTPLRERALSDEDEEQVLYPPTTARPRTPYGNAVEISDREISWVASPGMILSSLSFSGLII